MATRRSTGLRTEEVKLQQSRSLFIQTLEQKRQFEADCAVIIPELDKQWKEKILIYFPHVDDTNVINWRHYLYNYTPQLLQKAITQLASRLDPSSSKAGIFDVIINVSAYYKSLVQDLRRREIARTK